jgi:glycosyltransferase involved in cell wall biosynthesis
MTTSEYDIVFFSLFRTDNAYSSISMSMAKEMCRTNRVFYVNHPYTIRDVITGLRNGDPVLRKRLPYLMTGRIATEKVQGLPENFTAFTPPVTLPINWLPNGLIYNFFQKINNGIVLRAIKLILKKQHINNFIYINCYDPYYAGYLPKRFGAAASIYHCIDDITQNPYSRRHGADLETVAIRHADITLATSSNLVKIKIPLSGRVVPFYNAADVALFSQAASGVFPRPPAFNGIKGKIIGFTGNLDELRIDYPLLKKVAIAYPDATLMLVGPVNSAEPAAIGLDQLPNVIFTGSRPIEVLPAYLQHMDCVLIPFNCNTLTQSIYPLKINEYLAAGKPVVSTGFSDDIRSFATAIYIGKDHPGFIQQVGKALGEADSRLVALRQKIAASNTWEARINQLWKLVKSII